MRPLPLLVAWGLSALGFAQQSPAPVASEPDAVTILRQRLRDTAAAGPTVFEVRWQPPSSAAATGQRKPDAAPEPESAKGSFGPDWLLVEQASKQQAWLQVGRHVLTRVNAGTWQLSGPKRMAFEGTDPPLLLRALAANIATVASRTIADRSGVPIEQFTVCLDPVQAALLTSAGAMFEPSPMQAVARTLVKSGQVQVKDVPVPVVDVCIDVDVATHRVRRVHVRAMSRVLELGQLMGRGRRGAAGPDPAEAADAKDSTTAEPAASSPKEFRDGLPVRDGNGMFVVWLEVVMRDHGKAPAVQLDDVQKALLGR